jgi:hypothetical protein
LRTRFRHDARVSDGFGNASPMSRIVTGSLVDLRERFGNAFLVVQGRAPPAQDRKLDDTTYDTIETVGVGDGAMQTPVRGLVYVVIKKPASTFAWVSVGRNENNDVHMPHASVSRFQALLREEGGAWVIHDAKSANGTFVDGTAAIPHGAGRGTALKAGAQIRFGEILTVFLDATALHSLAGRTRSREPMPGVGR